MKLLLDQGLPRSCTSLLARAGIDAAHVGDLGMSEASDVEILNFAAESQRVVVTLDADFHGLLAERSARGPSVIRIRIEGLSSTDASDVILRAISVVEDELSSGAAVTVTPTNVRVRLLPLGARLPRPK
jgi:predicted nuclease of predicted toxin-antitoxin system